MWQGNILIVLSFNPCFDGSVARGWTTRRCCGWKSRCFNPCFDGSVARGTQSECVCSISQGFNPCFDGSVARGIPPGLGEASGEKFQSLF